MKKNITVNIFGSLYRMDEDAYAMLNAYIANMRDYFSRQPDGKEIADDIEGRAAELMSELSASGIEAISIEHVDDIVRRIGNPEELICEDAPEDSDVCETQDAGAEEEAPAKRRLYRNTDHKVIAGVCSGAGCYFGINPLWIRLLFIILLIPSFGIAAVIYILCWVCIPPATTAADRLRMKGEPINISNLCNEFLNSTRDIINRGGDLAGGNDFTRTALTFFKWTCYASGIMLAGFCALILIGAIISLICAVSAPWGDMRELMGDNNPIIMILDSNPIWLIATGCASVLVLLILTLHAIVHFTLHMTGKVRPMSRQLRLACVSVWILALTVFLMVATNIVSNVNIKYTKPNRESWERYQREREEREARRQTAYLEDGGWILTHSKGLDGITFRSGEHYSGNERARYLDACQDGKGDWMEYEVMRQLKVAPGTYTLKASVRANGTGAELFAVNGKQQRYSAEIPACGNKGGSIWNDARLALEADSLKHRPDRDFLKKIARANDKKGYGWSEIAIDGITVGADSVLNYGISTLSPTRSWEGTRISATGFELGKNEK